MQNNSKTKIFAIIGYPLKYTISPKVHNAAFEHSGYNARYVALKIPPEYFKKEIMRLKQSDIAGFNVTIPYKEAIIPLLDGLSCEAKTIGAVNIVVVKKRKFIGYNTDGEGFLRSLKDKKISPKGKRIICLGAGGAARAVVWALAKEGASKITIANRTKVRVKKLVLEFRRKFTKCAFRVIDFKAAHLEEGIANSDILINTTSVGMNPSDTLLLRPEWLKRGLIVYDIIYKDTPLIKAAKRCGLVVINGLGMFIHQAALSFKLWTGQKAPVAVMRRAVMRDI